MTDIHTIRLHAAWKRMDECGSPTSIPEQCSVSLPDTSLLGCEAPTVTYQRRFNRPSGLSETATVHLHCGLLPLATEIRFNGELQAVPSAPLIDLSNSLKPHNVIEMVIEKSRFGPAATASAKLEIAAAPPIS
jgi:hypothetical protein